MGLSVTFTQNLFFFFCNCNCNIYRERGTDEFFRFHTAARSYSSHFTIFLFSSKFFSMAINQDPTSDSTPQHHAKPTKPACRVLPSYQTARLEDHYSLGKTLGKGQFGTAYLCTHKATQKLYACKSIRKRKLLRREDYEDVWREIQIMHHLSKHPKVVQIKGAYEDSTSVHIVMELCGGGDLFDRIIKKGHFCEPEAAKLIKMIVGIVEALHSRGVMHRDLKPENFLLDTLDDDAVLKVIDFGLSVFFKPGEVFSDAVGSQYYVAPEVLLGHYGPEVDVWSAGVILYILLSGVLPFCAATEPEMLREVSQGHLDLDSDPWTSISDSAKDLVKKMLERDPRKRLSAQQVLRRSWIVDDGVALDIPLNSVPEAGLGCKIHGLLNEQLAYQFPLALFPRHPWTVDDGVAPDNPLDSVSEAGDPWIVDEGVALDITLV